jgi:integrase
LDVLIKKFVVMEKKRKKSVGAQVAVAELVALREAKHRSNTQGVNHALLCHLECFCCRPALLGDITEEFCADFAKFLSDRVSRGSVRTYLQKLHAVLEYAVAMRLLPSNPMPAVRLLMPGGRMVQRVYLTQDEVARLSRTRCRHEETKRAFLFACQTGLRLSDIETLVWEDVVDVDGAPTIVKTQVKTGREVCVPLNAVARGLLGERGTEEKVFSLRSRSSIAADLAQWAHAAGIGKHVTFHVSRHTFATMAITAGVDIYVVSRLCGHSTVRTTEVYAHIVDKTLRRGVALMEESMKDIGVAERKAARMGFAEWLRGVLLALVLHFGFRVLPS